MSLTRRSSSMAVCVCVHLESMANVIVYVWSVEDSSGMQSILFESRVAKVRSRFSSRRKHEDARDARFPRECTCAY